MTRGHDIADRIRTTRMAMEFAEALGGEGFTDDDVTDALFRAACRRIGNKTEFLDWAKDVACLEFDAG